MAQWAARLGSIVAIILLLAAIAVLPGLLWPDDVTNSQSLAFSEAHPG